MRWFISVISGLGVIARCDASSPRALLNSNVDVGAPGLGKSSDSMSD
jgi:hypothetical protein